MHEVEIYQNSNGKQPFDKFILKLSKQHKDELVTLIMDMIDKLGLYGLRLGEIQKKSIKNIRDGIYELRPIPARIFFFYKDGDKFIILHGFEKKSNKTPREEIEKAIKEKNDYLKRYENG